MDFSLFLLLLLFQELVFLEVRGQLEYLLAQPRLLSIAFYNLGPLLSDHSLLKLLLPHLLDLLFPVCNLLGPPQVLLPLRLLHLQVHPVLPKQVLKLLLLFENPLVSLQALSAARRNFAAHSIASRHHCPLRRRARAVEPAATIACRQVDMLLPRLGDRLRQDVAYVLVRLHSVVQGHAGDRLGHWRRSAWLLEAWVQHLLLLEEELLLLLLEHSLLENLLELQLDLFWQLLALA